MYDEAVALAGDATDRDAVLRQLYMLVKRELGLTDWPTTNEQDPYGFAIFEMVTKYADTSFNPYIIWAELDQHDLDTGS